MASPRITYNSVNIDLVMGKTGLKTIPKHIKYYNESGSGQIENISLYGRIEYEFDAYFSQAVYYTLWGWWSWARQGKEWAFALDSANVGDTTLDASAASGQKVIPLTATAAFANDDYCFIKAVDVDDEFEIVQIDSISAGVSVTVKSNLVYSYNASDVFRHKDYFSSVVLAKNANNFSPDYTGVKDVTKKYHKYTFKFIEVL